jgi:hypothetical protein
VPEEATPSSDGSDEVPEQVGDEEWLVRYVDSKAVNKAGRVSRGAFSVTREPAQISVDRMAFFAQTAAKAANQGRIRVFVKTGAIRAASSPGIVRAAKPPPEHALIIPARFPQHRTIVSYKKYLSEEEHAVLSEFCDGLAELAKLIEP